MTELFPLIVCPVCKTAQQVTFLGVRTLTIECGARTYTDEDGYVWFTFRDHTSESE